jgi:glycosyltransferase involved in cell wall biosynthesis
VNFLFTNSARVWGGNERWTQLAVREMSDKHSVWVAYRNPEIGDRFQSAKIRLPFYAEIDPITIYSLVGLVRSKGIDVIIPTKRKDLTIAGIVAKLTGCMNIIRLGIERDLKNKFLNDIVYNRLADGIIVNAEAIKSTLLRSRFMDASKIRVINNGLDLNELDISSHSGPGLRDKYEFIVCSVGRITGVKRVDILVDAFYRFLEQTKATDALLLIIGDGDSLPSIKQQVNNYGIGERVLFTGYIDNPYRYIIESDIFVSTSQAEGISNAMIEAMYLGNVVISTPAGDAVQLMRDGETGYLIDFGSFSALAGILIDLYYNSGKKASIIKKAREMVSEKFRIDRMVNEIIEFVTEISFRRNRNR